MCATKSLRKAKSRLPLWGALVPSGHRSALDRAGRREWTRVSEDGEGKLPAAPSHGLCGSAGGLPSQSRLPPCQLPRRGSQVGTQPEVCRKPSLASPFGGGAPAGGGEGEALRRPGKALRCFPSFLTCAARPVRARSWGAAPHPASFLSRKLGKELYPLRAAFSYSPSVHLRISSKNAWPYFCSLAWPTPGTSSSSAGVRGW